MSIDSIITELRQNDGRTRRLEAALRVARGYVLRDVTPQGLRDLATLDKALTKDTTS